MQASPESVALEFEPTGQRVVYADFWARVCGLALHLQGLGVKAEMLVPLRGQFFAGQQATG